MNTKQYRKGLEVWVSLKKSFEVSEGVGYLASEHPRQHASRLEGKSKRLCRSMNPAEVIHHLVTLSTRTVGSYALRPEGTLHNQPLRGDSSQPKAIALEPLQLSLGLFKGIPCSSCSPF